MLIENTEEDLLAIRNFGKRSLTEVIEKLSELDLTLKASPSELRKYGAEEMALGDEAD
jgi:DNA-directed RNA polymerase subunit alpha